MKHSFRKAVVFFAFACEAATAQSLDFYELEPNQTGVTGTALPLAALGGGQFSSDADVDYFRYTSPGTAALTVTLSPQDPNYDGGTARVQLFDSQIVLLAGTEVSSDSDAPPLRAVVGAGVYCLRIDEVSGYQSLDEEYRTAASADSSDAGVAQVEAEPNDT